VEAIVATLYSVSARVGLRSGRTLAPNFGGDDLEPAWSPNAQNIAYASKRGGDFEIVIVDVEQGQELALTSNDTDDREPTWAPDGTRIAFTRNGIIHVMNVSPRSAQIPLRRGSSPSWGADPVYSTPASPTFVVPAPAAGPAQFFRLRRR
jgi:TolB protein